MKRFFVLTAFLIFSFSTVLTSCTSSSLKIPGEDGVRVSSIYKEYFSIAQAYEEQKNYTKAVTYYKMAQNDKALKETAFYRTGRCYALSKDWDNALFYYNELLKKDPENTSLRLSVAYINAMKGELDAASKEYEALLADSVDAAVYKNYISVLIAQKNGEKASELLERFTADFLMMIRLRLYTKN